MLSRNSTEKFQEQRNTIMDRIALQRRFLFVKRIFKIKHMDFEFALWQMLYLFISPKRVYRNFSYHQETKRQWSRDDPAFLVLLSIWLFASSTVFSIALSLSFTGFLKLLFWVIFVDCIGLGLLVAGILSIFVNRYLRFPGGIKHQERVEFGYSFDVHLNAFFPLLLMLHVVQLIYFLFSENSFMARFIGNTIWLIALLYYCYITFLGYSCLPFLRGTVTLLFPVVLVSIFYFVSLFFPALNLSHMLINFYRYRVSHYAL